MSAFDLALAQQWPAWLALFGDPAVVTRAGGSTYALTVILRRQVDPALVLEVHVTQRDATLDVRKADLVAPLAPTDRLALAGDTWAPVRVIEDDGQMETWLIREVA